MFCFYFILYVCTCVDPNQQSLLNTDPIRIRIHNTALYFFIIYMSCNKRVPHFTLYFFPIANVCTLYSMYFALRYVNVTVYAEVYIVPSFMKPHKGGGSRLGYKQARLGYFDMLNKLRHLQHSSCKFFERYRNIFKQDTGIKDETF